MAGDAHRVDAHASARHLVDHLLPIWNALPEDVRGTFTVPHRGLAKQLPGVTFGEARNIGGLTLIANRHDLTQIHPKRPVAYVEHGAGQTYRDHPSHPSYSGGTHRAQVVLFLTLNETTAARERAAYPKARVEVVGSPRLDVLTSRRAAAGSTSCPGSCRPVVAFAWHWDLALVPETRQTFTFWRPALRGLTEKWEVLGHGHPRIFASLVPHYERMGIEAVEDFGEVVWRADVLAFDNSSAGYEAAALGIPVVALNSPKYRRDVEHGLRFWSDVPGPQCDEHEALPGVLDFSLRQGAWPVRVYPPATRGRAAQLAADAIVGILSETAGAR